MPIVRSYFDLEVLISHSSKYRLDDLVRGAGNATCVSFVANGSQRERGRTALRTAGLGGGHNLNSQRHLCRLRLRGEYAGCARGFMSNIQFDRRSQDTLGRRRVEPGASLAGYRDRGREQNGKQPGYPDHDFLAGTKISALSILPPSWSR